MVGNMRLETCCSGPPLHAQAGMAHGDLALSLLMTSASTLAAVVMTPTLVSIYAGSIIPVNGAALAVSVLKLVLLPTVLGVLINEFATSAVRAWDRGGEGACKRANEHAHGSGGIWCWAC
jgi:BASS family bile acid:Na+ symporter